MNSLEQGRSGSGDKLLWLIVLFKLLHVLMLLAVGLGALHLLNRDMSEFADQLVDLFRVDPDNRHIHGLLEKLQLVNAKQLKELSIGSFVYAAITLTEGAGLAFRKRWAEYFTIVITGSFLPLEIYEIIRHTTAMKFLLLAVNLAILGYLIARVRRPREANQK